MTCVVGIVRKEGVYLGADSGAFNEDDLTYNVRKDEKIFKRGEMIIGFCSSFRMGQLLRYRLELPKHPRNMDDLEYMSTLFVDAVKTCFEQNDYDDFKEEDCNFMVGYKGGLYVVMQDFQVAVHDEGYAAIGSGEAIAIGALYATKEEPAEKSMEIALNAAENHSMAVKKPFKYVSLLNTNTKKLVTKKTTKK
jgi:ATP-dependent protease HslVU (ClpYQ) peptidase subunit